MTRCRLSEGKPSGIKIPVKTLNEHRVQSLTCMWAGISLVQRAPPQSLSAWQGDHYSLRTVYRLAGSERPAGKLD